MTSTPIGQGVDLQPLRDAALLLSRLSNERNDPAMEQESRRLLKATRAIQAQLEAEELLVAMSNRLLNLPLSELRQGIGDALGELGRLTQVERVYVFLLDTTGKVLDQGHEWVSPGTKGYDIPRFSGAPVSTFPWSMERFERGETIYVDDPAALPEQAVTEKKSCERLDICAYVNMPMFLHGTLIGWLGFDSVGKPRRDWTHEQLALMRLACDVLANAIGRHRRDERLLREEELRERMVALGTLSAGLAHELNNPLSFALGNVQYLRQITPDATRATEPWQYELSPILGEVETGLERASSIVTDLRAFLSRPTDDSDSVDLDEMIEMATRIAGGQLRRRARLELELKAHGRVKGTLARLSQVFINLLVNAAKAIPEEDPEHHRVTIRSRRDGQYVDLEVEDTGVGIPSDQIGHIFDPFFTTRRVGEGLGLGLSLCNHIISSVSGEISVTSELGRGTTFRVRLRRADDNPPTRELPVIRDPREQQVQVLIVDDEPHVLSMLARMLKGHRLQMASNGREAQTLMKRERFAVVLCDVMMSDLTGIDLFRWATEHDKHPEGFVFMSGGVLTQKLRTAIDETKQPLLFKPFDIVQLKSVVREHVERAAAIG
ncbi:MAG: ATP-binding protein [Myxococcota bacterium]